MHDTIKSVGFPIGVIGFIVAWSNIATNKDNVVDIIILFISTYIMFFMYNYNLKQRGETK